jgi:hypothetical protein
MPNGSSGVSQKSRLFDFAFCVRRLTQRTHSSSLAAKVKIKRCIKVRTPLPHRHKNGLTCESMDLPAHKKSKSFFKVDNA